MIEKIFVDKFDQTATKARLSDGRLVRAYHDPGYDRVEDEDCDYPVCFEPAHYALHPFRYDNRHGWVRA